MANKIDQTQMNLIKSLNEIKWIISKCKSDTPYSDSDYTEQTFSGKLPGKMAYKIKSNLKPYYNDTHGGYCIYTVTHNTEGKKVIEDMTIRFSKRNKNYITFMMTSETEME